MQAYTTQEFATKAAAQANIDGGNNVKRYIVVTEDETLDGEYGFYFFNGINLISQGSAGAVEVVDEEILAVVADYDLQVGDETKIIEIDATDGNVQLSIDAELFNKKRITVRRKDNTANRAFITTPFNIEYKVGEDSNQFDFAYRQTEIFKSVQEGINYKLIQL